MQNPRVRVAGILIKEGKILLIRHQKKDKTYWLLPGGGVDYGEIMEDSLQREFLEECNLNINIKDLAFVSQGVAPDNSRHIIHMTFMVDYISGDLRVGDEEILKEVKFVPIEKIDEITLYPNIKMELKRYIKGDNKFVYLGNRWE